jgi:valyl-tRNA synthetase
MKVGRRLAIKLLNASKFVLGIGGPDAGVPDGSAVTEPIDKAMLAELAEVVKAATGWFDALDYARALERTEEFFWNFCDNYLELVKDRAYGEHPVPGTASARAALRIALSAVVRLFAPFLPFAAEEVWSWWQDGSVHRAAWPSTAELAAAAGDADREVLTVAAEVIAAVRKAKSEAKLSMRTEVTSVSVAAPPATLDRVQAAEDDLRAAGRIAKIDRQASADGDLRVTVDL